MRLKTFVEVITNRTNIRNQRNTISLTNNGHTTMVQNNKLLTDNVKPECQLDQPKKKSLTGHIDQSRLIMFDRTKLIKKTFGSWVLLNAMGETLSEQWLGKHITLAIRNTVTSQLFC